jgi:hypothetical protein
MPIKGSTNITPKIKPEIDIIPELEQPEEITVLKMIHLNLHLFPMKKLNLQNYIQDVIFQIMLMKRIYLDFEKLQQKL